MVLHIRMVQNDFTLQSGTRIHIRKVWYTMVTMHSDDTGATYTTQEGCYAREHAISSQLPVALLEPPPNDLLHWEGVN